MGDGDGGTKIGDWICGCGNNKRGEWCCDDIEGRFFVGGMEDEWRFNDEDEDFTSKTLFFGVSNSLFDKGSDGDVGSLEPS